jgi:DNA-binding MarR family transcriptional regulator
MANPSSVHPEVAVRAWSAMHAFVAAHDRRKELQEALDLGRGLGRVKVLLLLTGGSMTLRDIAAANGVDAPYATVIVDKLVSRGLVERTAHPDDLRRKLVKLTASGRDAVALAEQILAKPPGALLALPPSDLAILGDVLARLMAATVNVLTPDGD